jgi:predicted amino acid-binding ACT domain protein
MSQQFVISIMTRDRVGIIADVTAVIQRLRGNLADLSQTVQGGYFTMLVAASFPETVKEEDIRLQFRALDDEEPFEVGIKAAQPSESEPEAAMNKRKYVLTVTGPDRVGFVALVSECLRKHHINIEDLTTTVTDGHYFMALQLNLPAAVSLAELKENLQLILPEIKAKFVLQHYDIFKATNEI